MINLTDSIKPDTLPQHPYMKFDAKTVFECRQELEKSRSLRDFSAADGGDHSSIVCSIVEKEVVVGSILLRDSLKHNAMQCNTNSSATLVPILAYSRHEQ